MADQNVLLGLYVPSSSTLSCSSFLLQLIHAHGSECRRSSTGGSKYVAVCNLFYEPCFLLSKFNRLMFWAVDDNLYNSAEMLKISTKTLDKALDSASPEDVNLLKDAYHHL